MDAHQGETIANSNLIGNPPPYIPYHQFELSEERSVWPKLMGYRILVLGLTAGFGLWKARLASLGYSTAFTTTDWLHGICIFLL